MSALLDKLKDDELDVLVRYKQGENLDDATLNGLSDDALDAMLEIKQQKPAIATDAKAVGTDATVMTPGNDGIDHSLPEGFGTDVYVAEQKAASEQEKPSAWDRLKRGFKNSVALKVADDAVNIVSPVEVEISDRPDTIRKSMDNMLDNIGDENDVGFDVYNKIGLLSKTANGLSDIGIGEASKEDIDTYNKNLSSLMVDKMGYKDLLFDDDSGKYYVETKDGEYKQLGKDTIKTILGEVFGDKAEIAGGIVGAKKGYDLGKVAGWKGKAAGALVGGATGATLGNIADQFASAIETGEKLNIRQRVDEVGKAAALDTAGALVGGAVIKTAGAAIKVPGVISKKIYGHIANGNIDGARKVLKSDLGIDDAFIDDALAQMQKSQQEVYTTERNIVDDAMKTARDGDIKGALKQLGDGALDTLGDAQQKEEFLAAALKHPQGDKIIKEALNANPKGAFELEKSIDARAKQVNESLSGLTGTEAKDAVERYEARVQNQYADMRDTFSEAFKETGYRFDLGDLKLDDTLDDLQKRVTDPFVKDKFEAMTGAVKNIIDGSKSGVGVERDVDALLDIRQMMNRFYKKNQSAFELRPDKKKFFEMVKSVDTEIERALDTHLNPDIKKEMLGYFDKARADYSAMFDIQESGLYKALMKDGKSAQERVDALLKNAKGDNNELQKLLGKLEGDEAVKVEDTLVQAIVQKYTKGVQSQMQSIDYAQALDDLKDLKPFLKSDGAKESINLVEDIYSKFRHDFELAKSVKSVGENIDGGGIGSSVQGRLAVAAASKMFRYVMTLIPWGETPKRLALYRHIGSALKKSRTPVELAKRLQDSPALLPYQRSNLKELIKVNNAALRADNEVKARRVVEQIKEVETKIIQEQEAKVSAIKEFKKPDISEIRAVEIHATDDRFATLARSIRAIQEGKATEADIKRYLDAKETIEPKRLEHAIEKERVNNLAGKYRNVGEEEIAKISRLRDYLMGHADLKFGNEFNAQKVKALVYDLRTQGKPRSTEYDRMYDDMMDMYKELAPRIDEAYGTVGKAEDEILDANGNSLFVNPGHMGSGVVTGTVNAYTNGDIDGDGVVTNDEFTQAFLMGMAGGTAGSKAIAVGLKKLNPKLYTQMEKAWDDGVRGDNLAGMFVGAKPDKSIANASKHLKDIASKKAKELGLDGVIDDVYVVGSRANGKQKSTSDIDILIKTKYPNGDVNNPKLIELEEYLENYTSQYMPTKYGIGKKEVKADYFVSPEFDNRNFFKAEDWHETGTFSNIYDKGVRKWIDDIGATMKPLDETKVSHRLEDVIDHKELFDAYPDLKDMRVSKGSSSYYSPQLKHIKIGKVNSADNTIIEHYNKLEEALYDKYIKFEVDGELPKPIEAKAEKELENLYSELRSKLQNKKEFDKSTLLHEVQHAIQEKEKWARGGSSDLYKEEKAMYTAIQSEISRLDEGLGYNKWWEDNVDEIADNLRGKPYDQDNPRRMFAETLSDDIKSKYLAKIEEARRIQKDNKEMLGLSHNDYSDPYYSYIRLAGEQEARATQAALKYPELEPYQALAKEEGKLPEPIVKMDDGVMMSEGKIQRDANLKEWHKDSHALTKNEDGTPKVFYHGTNTDFDVFDTGKARSGWLSKGIYLTSDKDEAMGYGSKLIEANINLKKPFVIQGDKIKPDGTVEWAKSAKEQIQDAIGGDKDIELKDASKYLADMGYDGIINGQHSVAFESNQIKSIHNKGTYNPNDPNILNAHPATVAAATALAALAAQQGESK